MILHLTLAAILWLVAPPLIDGHIKKRTDRKALRLLCRIIALLLIVLSIYRVLPL